MRIGMIAPLEFRLPPIAYGGSEQVVSLLTEELVRRGHYVTLFATGDSITNAELVPGAPYGLRGTDRDSSVLNMLNVAACMERAVDFDVIHNHVPLEGMPLAALVETPVLTTFHGGFAGDWIRLYNKYRGWYNTISNSASSLLELHDRYVGVIYNAIDVDSYPYNPGVREDFALFLSRISHEKGPDIAIEAAIRGRFRLVIAGNVDEPDKEFFESRVLPRVDGDQIQYVGEVDARMKRDLYSRARFLLAPITWEEPFGLFFAEAMACGTPVIAFNRGAAPEVIEDGITGYIVEDVEAMVDATLKIDRIDPARCRKRVEDRFNVRRMADDYQAAYGEIVENQSKTHPEYRDPAQLALPLLN